MKKSDNTNDKNADRLSKTGRMTPSDGALPEFPIRVGILRSNFMNGIVRSDVPGAFEDIFISRENLNGAPFGMEVVCEIIDAPSDYEMRGRQYYSDELTGRGMAKGRIKSVLGEPGTNDTAISGILLSYGLKPDFPKDVLQAAKKFSVEVSEEELTAELQNGRTDRRDELVITIDGADAKDLDDAVSISKTKGNHVVLGVHIADVAHYVTEEGTIDKEAAARGTSVYLADRVIPMLPQVLSNGLCSLHPGKPKFALSVLMELDENGSLLSSEITESVIHSKARFTYDEVYRMLGPDREIIEALESFRPMLELLHETAVKLRERRFSRGAINFEFPETKLKLDDEKNVLDVSAAPATFANEMIEECMIACNEAVAERFARLEAPFIYRVHEQPDAEKIERFIKTARLFGEKIRFSTSLRSDEIHRAIRQIDEKPYGATLMQLLLRSMAKARYANRCLGHFGLASSYYCHFTSPIRRYPDLFIHRVVKTWLHNKTFPAKWIKKSAWMSDLNSDSERNAMMAERASVDFKTAEYMERHVGESFEGLVTGMFHAGIFVQLENTIEGMVPFRTMNGYYEFDEDRMLAWSDAGNKVIRFGDKVTVKVFQADRIARRIEFSLDESKLAQETDPRKGRASRSARHPSGSGSSGKTGRRNSPKSSGNSHRNGKGKKGNQANKAKKANKSNKANKASKAKRR